ncbi:MAG: Asp23/Gls24 family envelope stress response protein [Candidatus Omnitrophota bacterium]
MANDLSQQESSTDIGSIKINNEVISSVACSAAMEVDGVHKIVGSIGRGLLGLITRNPCAKGARVISEDSETKIKMSIIVEYGNDIPFVADMVQKNVKSAVEKMTGLHISAVDISVEGVCRNQTNDVERQGARSCQPANAKQGGTR